MIRVNRSHPLNIGRLAWWMGVPGRMGGTTLVDLMDRYPARVQGTARWSNARPFAGPSLDGSTVYRAAADSLGNTMSGPATWGVRFTPDAAFVSNIGIYPILFARWTDTYGDYIWSQALVAFPDNTVHTDSVSAFNYSAPWTPVAGAESMLVWTWNGSRNGFKFYVNGVSQAVTEGAWNAPSVNTAGAPFNIGGHTTTRKCSGLMSEAFVWNRVLSDAEAAQLYAGSRVGYPGLLIRDRSPIAVTLPQAFKPWYSPGHSGFLGTGAA